MTGGRLGRIVTHAVLIVGVLVSVFPFYWMLVMATNSTSDVFRFPPKFLFGGQLLTNIHHVLSNVDFFGALLNTVLVAVSTTVLVLFLDSLAAFTFAKYRFPGRRALFVILLGTMMIPSQLSTVPQFVVMAHLGWVGSLKALVVPAAANAFGIFWMRQYIEGAVHDDLLDAARLDGCGFLRLYRHVALPVLRPGLAFLGIFTFITAWNDYLWPLVVMADPKRETLQLALSQLNTLYNTDYSMVMAGTLMGTLPLILIFVLGARHFVRDLAAGALKN
jgi:cellobiose transport system permease protein